ncbi:MAG: small subunit ribosomal protein S9 [Glaciecola sp.]|jgi:small subunit ribosomal protein S9
MAELFTGRRKASVARVSITRGSGTFSLNGRTLEDYFQTEKLRYHVMLPFETVEQAGMWDVKANIHGGGTTGQAGAVRLGIARALMGHDPELRPVLKAAGLIERDARKVERKKFGLKKARRAPQFSKR